MEKLKANEKYVLSPEESAEYFHIGINKLRRIINENKDAEWIVWNGMRPAIKRVKFEQLIDRLNAI